MIDPAIIDEARDLVRVIAPELPCYIIEQPPELPTPAGTAAYATSGFCAPLKAHLVSRGLWTGPQPIITLVDTDRSRERLLEVVLHEAAHLLPYTPQVEPEHQDEAAAVAAFTEWADAPHSGEAQNTPRWFPAHDQNWHRIAMHLWWRAAIAGTVVPQDELLGGWHYDLSPWALYFRAFGNEGVKLAGLSFAEILATPAPKDFCTVWDSDLAHWMQTNPKSISAIRSAAA